MSKPLMMMPPIYHVESAYVGEDVRLGELSPASHYWLKDAVYQNRCFLPAKLGMLLISEAKNPNRVWYKKLRRKSEEFLFDFSDNEVASQSLPNLVRQRKI